MNKSYKIITTLVLTFCIFFSNFAVVSAYNNAELTELQLQYLEEYKREHPEVDFSDQEIVSVNVEHFSVDHNGEKHKIQPYGAISSSDMKLTTVVTRIPTTKRMKITSTARWLIKPFWKFTDVFGVAWSNGHTLNPVQSHISSYYTSASGKKYHYTNAQLANSVPGSGRAFYIPMLKTTTNDSNHFLDYVTMVTDIDIKDGSGSSSNITTKYGHAMVSLGAGFSVSFPAGGGLSFKLNGSKDEAIIETKFNH